MTGRLQFRLDFGPRRPPPGGRLRPWRLVADGRGPGAPHRAGRACRTSFTAGAGHTCRSSVVPVFRARSERRRGWLACGTVSSKLVVPCNKEEFVWRTVSFTWWRQDRNGCREEIRHSRGEDRVVGADSGRQVLIMFSSKALPVYHRQCYFSLYRCPAVQIGTAVAGIIRFKRYRHEHRRRNWRGHGGHATHFSAKILLKIFPFFL